VEAVTLAVQARKEKKGSASARRLRAGGGIPGVVYGKKSKTMEISIIDGEFRRALRHGQTVLLELDYGREAAGAARQYAVIKEIQRDMLRDVILNVDLEQVYLDVEIESRVPVEVHGEAVGSAAGGILSQLVHELDVRALPEKMPVKFEVDVTGLDVGDRITAGELLTSADYVLLADPDEVIVAVLAPRVTEAEAEPEEAGAEESL